jgi:hypothetical protein
MSEPSPRETLSEEVRTWKHNRAVYPGWLIAPDSVRERLWHSTQSWLPYYLEHRSSLGLPHDLDVLFEINWRLETVLIPFGSGLMDLVPAFTYLLGAINPFPHDLTDLPAAATVLTNEEDTPIDPAVVRRQWLALAFGLLRHHREEGQADSFDTLHARLGRIRDLDGDARARWCYERCLFALGEMDDEAVMATLRQWPDKTHDPYWTVRKAAVLAEVGRTDQALTAVESAIAVLREGLSDSAEHIPGLSREGWAVWLAMMLKANQEFRAQGVKLTHRAEVRRRFEQLKMFSCDPDEFIDYFKSRLDQPAPQARPQAEVAPHFQPGIYSRTVHLDGGIASEQLVAYQCLRLVEETGCPPQVGHVIVGGRIMKRAATWLSEYDPVRTRTLVFRLAHEKLSGQYFNRHRVAALRPEVVARVGIDAHRCLLASLPGVPAAVRPETDEGVRASERLRCAVDLLSRVCVREIGAGLEDLWELACRLYKEPAVRSAVGYDSLLRELFESLIRSTPRARLIERLPSLLRLPVAGEGDFRVSFYHRWPDPFILAADRVPSQVWQPVQGWDEIIGRHFNLASTGVDETKKAAFHRLTQLNDLGALSAVEQQRLADIFWTPAGQTPALPVESWGHGTPWFALTLPDARGVDAVDRVRQHILASQPGEAHGGVVQPGSYFRLVLFATKPLDVRREVSRHRRYIAWRPAEIRQLFGRVQDWWMNRGRKRLEELRTVSWLRAFDSGSFSEFVSWLLDMVGRVIIPRLRRGRSSVEAVGTLVDGMKSAGLSVGAILPATLILQPDSVREVASELRQELANPDGEHILSALRGIVFWVNRNADTRRRSPVFPKIPVDLLREVGAGVAVRRPESLLPLLDCAYNVVGSQPGGIDRQLVQSLLIGLDYLFAETEYRESAPSSSHYRYGDIPRIRWQAARLANCLAGCGYDAEPIIQRWSERTATDALPEIRRIVTEPDREFD